MLKKAIYLMSILMVFSCSDSSDKADSPASIEKEKLLQQAWLHHQLPDNTLAYVRLPNPWFLMSGQDNGFEFAQSNAAHNEQIRSIQNGLFRNFIDSSSLPSKASLELFLKHMTAPLEIAVIPERPGQVMPISMVATKLDFTSQADFAEVFKKVVSEIPAIKQLAIIDQSGEGQLSIQGVSGHYSYNESNGEFRLMLGMFDMTTLKKAAGLLNVSKQSSLDTMQQQVDTSGEGLFAWINGKDLMPMLEMTLPPEQFMPMKLLNLEQVNALALGYGTANNKSRLRIAVDMPQVGIRELLPAVDNKLTLKTVEQPRAYSLLSIPTYEQVKAIILRVNTLNGGQVLADLDKSIAESAQLNFKELLSVFGPELILFKDSVGSFVATPLNNKAALAELLNQLESSGYGDYHTAKHNGQEIHHLKVKLMPQDESFPNAMPVSSYLEILAGLESHLFWIEEQGHLIFASIPQPLIERQAKGANNDLAQWVANNQGQNIENALFAAGGSFDDLSRGAYHTYIELLLLLAEITDADMNILAFPTADKLGFSDKGSLGFQVDSTENQLAMELTFEQGPLDILHAAGGMQAVAITGVLAAVAIPAYQDYVKRSEVAAALINAEIVKKQIRELIVSGVAIEAIDNETNGIEIAESYSNQYLDALYVEDGVITVLLPMNTRTYKQDTIIIRPKFEESDQLVWNCKGGTLPAKYRPLDCR